MQPQVQALPGIILELTGLFSRIPGDDIHGHTAPISPASSRQWSRHIHSAAVHTITLARMAVAKARAEGKSSDFSTRRIARLKQGLLFLKEEMRIKDGRMASIPAHRRSY